MSMTKQFTMDLMPEKETSGTHRYGFTEGDAGVTTIYLRKEAMENPSKPPMQLKVTVLAVNHPF